MHGAASDMQLLDALGRVRDIARVHRSHNWRCATPVTTPEDRRRQVLDAASGPQLRAGRQSLSRAGSRTMPGTECCLLWPPQCLPQRCAIACPALTDGRCARRGVEWRVASRAIDFDPHGNAWRTAPDGLQCGARNGLPINAE